MTRRLGQHWAALHHDLGCDPWQAEHWTLDEALVVEVYAQDAALSRRVAAAQRCR